MGIVAEIGRVAARECALVVIFANSCRHVRIDDACTAKTLWFIKRFFVFGSGRGVLRYVNGPGPGERTGREVR
jgi:hypothetical protein